MRGTLRPEITGACDQRGSVLIIVMWVAFGLVSLALYFGHSMGYELRASDNRSANLEAEQAIEGAVRYVNAILTRSGTNGAMPDPTTYLCESVPVGDARFWILGRANNQTTTTAPTEPTFALIDEASKLNLNIATTNMLLMLPRMTPELAAAILDWRDTDSNVSLGGAESETYNRLQPPYNCKNAPFESVEELRLVYGATLDILYGEDVNLNGVLDLNENDGIISLPEDNRDARLDPGLFEYITVYTRQPDLSSTRTNLSGGRNALEPLLQRFFGEARGNQILTTAGFPRGGGPGQTPPTFTSLLDFFIKSKMSLEEFAQVSTNLTTTNAPIEGLINVNTASPEVLACVPGIGAENAPALVSYRQNNRGNLTSIGWVTQVLDTSSATRAGPYLTTETFQFTADIAAVGHYGRGYSRARFLFDTSEGTPKIRHRQDLTRLGWGLGNTTRQKLLLTSNNSIR